MCLTRLKWQMVRQLSVIEVSLSTASRALAMAIDAARSLKRTDIVRPLCDFFSSFASLVPEVAQVPRAPPDASPQDRNGKQVIIYIKPERLCTVLSTQRVRTPQAATPLVMPKQHSLLCVLERVNGPLVMWASPALDCDHPTASQSLLTCLAQTRATVTGNHVVQTS